MKKNIVVIGPLYRDFRELIKSKQRNSYSFIYIHVPVASGMKYEECVDRVISLVPSSVHGVVSSGDYPGSLIASLVAEKLKVRAPSIEHVLLFQHKYESRMFQKKVVPEMVPQFYSYDQVLHTSCLFPLILKPIKSNFSQGVRVVNDKNDLSDYVILDDDITLFNTLCADFTSYDRIELNVMGEELLSGVQCTVEGFVVDGSVNSIGIVDSYMYPHTMSFERFVYPSVLPASVQRKMEQCTDQLIRASGLNNSFFNIEFMYDPSTQRITILEVNPRMASQFADLYEKVDGCNGYDLLIDLAVGKLPFINRKSGRWSVAASCVLRRFTNALVIRVPTVSEIRALEKEFPDLRVEITCRQGTLLSDALQDEHSFRYCLVHLGGTSHEQLEIIRESIVGRLQFEFKELY